MCYWITSVSRGKGGGERWKGIRSNLCLRIKIQFINHLNAFGRTGSVTVAVEEEKTAVQLLSRRVYSSVYTDKATRGICRAGGLYGTGPGHKAADWPGPTAGLGPASTDNVRVRTEFA